MYFSNCSLSSKIYNMCYCVIKKKNGEKNGEKNNAIYLDKINTTCKFSGQVPFQPIKQHLNNSQTVKKIIKRERERARERERERERERDVEC